MLTETELETIRKSNAAYVKGLSRALSIAIAQRSTQPRQYRSVYIAISRASHVFESVAQEFNTICRKSNRSGYLKSAPSTAQLITNKYLVTVLSILELLSKQDIPLSRWILAQAETIRIQHFTLYHCYGYNAMSRYESWEARQHKKYLLSKERNEQTDSKEQTIVKSVMDSHVSALKWSKTLLQIEAPCLSVALWYLWPAVSSWYLLAYPEFRSDILDNKLCDSPLLVKHWKTFMRSPKIQSACRRGLTAAETVNGKLEWRG